MHWLIFSAINVVAISVSSLFQKLAMKNEKSDPVTSTAIFQFLFALFGGVAALISGFHLPPSELFVYFIFSSILYAIGTTSFFRAAQILEASELTVLGSFGTIVTILISFFFLGERLSTPQWLGAAFILTGVTIVSYERTGIKFNSGVIWALVGAFCYGLGVTFDAYILRFYDALSFIPVISTLTGIVVLVIHPNKISKFFVDLRTVNSNLRIFTFLYVIGAISFYYPISQGILVSQMSSIGRVSIILTVILAMIFLKERLHIGKKILGAILTTIGIMLIK